MAPSQITRLLRIFVAVHTLTAQDRELLYAAINYIEVNEERSQILRPEPLFGKYDLFNSEGD